MHLKDVASGKESREKEIDGERMTQDEFNNQCNRFGRVVTFNNQLYIGPLTYEICAFKWMGWDSHQQQNGLEKKLSVSYAENRNLRQRLYTLLETMQAEANSQPVRKESAHPNITPRHRHRKIFSPFLI